MKTVTLSKDDFIKKVISAYEAEIDSLDVAQHLTEQGYTVTDKQIQDLYRLIEEEIQIFEAMDESKNEIKH